MQVFNAYFIIIRKSLPQLLIYVAVFMTLAVLLTIASTESPQTGFAESRINIAFFNYDNAADDGLASALTEGLREFLAKSANIINIEDNREKLQDALFFQKIAYILTEQGVETGFRFGQYAFKVRPNLFKTPQKVT